MYLLILQISYIFFLLRKAFFLLRSIIFHSPAIFKRGIAVNRTECRSKLALIAVSDKVSNISDAHFRASRKEFSRISELFSSDISAHRLTVKALVRRNKSRNYLHKSGLSRSAFSYKRAELAFIQKETLMIDCSKFFSIRDKIFGNISCR